MQSFLDRERDLSWITFKSSEYNSESYLSLIDKLNSWKSESLNRFILDCETENLGDLLSGYLSKCEESKIFFAFNEPTTSISITTDLLFNVSATKDFGVP